MRCHFLLDVIMIMKVFSFPVSLPFFGGDSRIAIVEKENIISLLEGFMKLYEFCKNVKKSWNKI